EAPTNKIVKEQLSVTIDWSKAVRVSRTNATLQAVVTPLMGRDSPVHDQIWSALRNLHANYVRYVPWLPYPKLAVAELEPPANGKTSWDFSLIDPYTEDFFKANPQLPVIINFSTIPQWMFKTPKPVPYPSNPDQVTWSYTQGTELRDPSMKELGDYYARLVSWYTRGGFTDEYGKRYESGHHFKFDHWEVLNEIDGEHKMTPEQYTERYDAIVTAIRKVEPKMKFVGLALAGPIGRPKYFEYFLNPKNHKPGMPIDMISYHFYASPAADQPPDTWQYTVFDQSARFIQTAKFVDAIRTRLSPSTGTTIDEIGVIAPDDADQGKPGYSFKPFPKFYWNLCAAQYAYLYGELSKLGIDAAGESALMQVPDFFPSVSMMDWNTGKPNARYWGLKLIRDNFGPGDKIVSARGLPTVYAFGVVTPAGKRKLMLVNMRNKTTDVSLPGAAGSQEAYVDQTTAYDAPASTRLTTDAVHLRGFSVAVITF
ncbi:MAG: glycosyl hydrolase family 39, partial [Acidobacteriaceae bacterium]